MKELLLSRNNKNLCPICNKPIDKEYATVIYNKTKLNVCKKHLKGAKNETETSPIQ